MTYKTEKCKLEIDGISLEKKSWVADRFRHRWVGEGVDKEGHRKKMEISTLSNGDIRWESKIGREGKRLLGLIKKLPFEQVIVVGQSGGFKMLESSEEIWDPKKIFDKVDELRKLLRTKEMQEWLKSENDEMGLGRKKREFGPRLS